MGILRRLLGLPPSPKEQVEEIFANVHRLLTDEEAQNDAMGPIRAMLDEGVACDAVPGGVGDFGRDSRNPIPVNGPLGELTYLARLRWGQDVPMLFHRLGAVDELDVFELASADGSRWDLLVLDMYHPCKSRLAPSGYRLAPEPDMSLIIPGTTTCVANFPRELREAVRTQTLSTFGLPLASSRLRLLCEQWAALRPDSHAMAVKALHLSSRPT